MNAVLDFLQQRNSSGKLIEPGPNDAELQAIFEAAIRAPDHGRLTPWRFVTISGEARNQLGQLFVKAKQLQGENDPDILEKIAANPMRAPLIVVVVARIQTQEKIPEVEQQLSAGCAAHGILLAAEALGYAGMWRTGSVAYDALVKHELGLANHEQITGFIYLGSQQGRKKRLPQLDPSDFVTPWPG